MRHMESFYRIWGGYEGKGLVIRSDDPVEFDPDDKIVNVVPVERLEDAVKYVNVATQTIGIFPPSRKAELRDALASAGAQRIVNLGATMGVQLGLPHDGFYPLHRMLRWIGDEG